MGHQWRIAARLAVRAAARTAEEAAVSNGDLLVMLPWFLFAVGLATVMLLAFTRDRRRDSQLRRRRSRPRRR
jgi:peptidoglycan biosynthesis protein MviN/MurJ (putative lipid II flippase)